MLVSLIELITILVMMVNLLCVFVRWHILAEFFNRALKLLCRDITVIIVVKDWESQHGLVVVVKRHTFQNCLLL